MIGWLWGFLVLLFIVVLFNSLRKVSPNEKWVKERLSRFAGILDPGYHVLWPFIDTVKTVDMRERVINTQPQEMITQDNAVVTVDATIYVQIFDAQKSVYEIQDPIMAVMNLSSTALRSIIWTMTLDQVLWERQKINAQVQTELSQETAKWWINILRIEIQRIDPPRELMDAMNKQKIAQQEKRAQILRAEWFREAAITEAEWKKQKDTLEAQWQAAAIEAIALAKAKALEVESNAAATYFKDNAVLKEQFRVLEESMKNNTKYILDSDILGAIKSFMVPKK